MSFPKISIRLYYLYTKSKEYFKAFYKDLGIEKGDAVASVKINRGGNRIGFKRLLLVINIGTSKFVC